MDSATLFGAIRAGDLATVDQILTEQPALAAASDDAGLTALTVAAYHRQWPIVERIQAADPDLDRYEATIVGDAGRVSARLDEAEREAGVERETAGRRRQHAAATDDGHVPVVDEPSPDGFSALHRWSFKRINAGADR